MPKPSQYSLICSTPQCSTILSDLPFNLPTKNDYEPAIYFQSLSTGYFLKIFKQAIMIFLPKENKTPYEHTKYRPISLLEGPGNIFEKILFSCNSALALLHEKKIVLSWDSFYTYGQWQECWLSFQGDKLGITDKMTWRLNNYLNDRTATIRICDYLGQTFGLFSGVPQGRCLSPTWSNLYIHP